MKSPTRLVASAFVILGLSAYTGTGFAQNWVKQSDMKVPRVEATSVQYRDDIYVFNGFKPGLAIANSIEKYDAATKQWSIIGSTTTMNDTAMTHNGVVRVGADVWLIGGRVGRHPGRVSNKIWIYNLNNRKWRRGPDMPKPVAAGGAALVNNKIHWFGGLDANARCDVNNHYVYDLNAAGKGWKDITSNAAMPSARNHFSTAVVNGIIYAMGGQYGHDNCPGKNTQDTTLVHAFDPKTNKWSKKAGLPNKNSHTEPGTFVYKGNIYTVGGENAKNKVWKYNPRSNKWSTYKTLPDQLVAPVARIVDGRLIVAGGGAPIAQKASNTVRSLLVDASAANNQPATTQAPAQAPSQAPSPTSAPVAAPEPTPAPRPAPIAAPVPGSGTPEQATLISMEAEYFDIRTQTSSHQWTHVARGNSSNDDAMITTPDEGVLAASANNTPMMSYLVYFNAPGKHYIWVRGYGDSNNAGIGSSDSIHVGLNGEIASDAFRIDQFPAEWTWSRHTPSNPVASLNVVDAGVNMVNLWMREDGLAIDKFVITSDPDFVPTGLGPDVTDGTDDYVAPVPVDETTTEELAVVDNPVLDDSANEASVSVPVSSDESDAVYVSMPESVESDVADDGIPTTLQELEVWVSDTSVAESKRSRGGLFGGSASVLGLLSLLMFGLIRLNRFEIKSLS